MLVTIMVEQLVPDDALHPDDRELKPRGIYHYYVEGRSLQDAEKQALDKFYWSTPLRSPTDFSVEATASEPAPTYKSLLHQLFLRRPNIHRRYQ